MKEEVEEEEEKEEEKEEEVEEEESVITLNWNDSRNRGSVLLLRTCVLLTSDLKVRNHTEWGGRKEEGGHTVALPAWRTVIPRSTHQRSFHMGSLEQVHCIPPTYTHTHTHTHMSP